METEELFMKDNGPGVAFGLAECKDAVHQPMCPSSPVIQGFRDSQLPGPLLHPSIPRFYYFVPVSSIRCPLAMVDGALNSGLNSRQWGITFEQGIYGS